MFKIGLVTICSALMRGETGRWTFEGNDCHGEQTKQHARIDEGFDEREIKGDQRASSLGPLLAQRGRGAGAQAQARKRAEEKVNRS